MERPGWGRSPPLAIIYVDESFPVFLRNTLANSFLTIPLISRYPTHFPLALYRHIIRILFVYYSHNSYMYTISWGASPPHTLACRV